MVQSLRSFPYKPPLLPSSDDDHDGFREEHHALCSLRTYVTYGALDSCTLIPSGRSNTVLI